MVDVATLLELRAQGLSPREIGERVGLRRTVVTQRLWRADPAQARRAAAAVEAERAEARLLSPSEIDARLLSPSEIDALVWARIEARRAAMGRSGAPWWGR